MANVQIYQLDNAGNDLDNSALMAVDIPNPDSSSASEIPYVTRKVSVAAMEQQMLNTEEYTTDLDTTAKTITGAINELNSSFTPYTETTITLTRAEGIPLTVPLIGVLRSGKVCILAFAHELPARTYAQGEAIWKVNPPPKGQVFSIVALGSAHPSITVLTNGDVRFNGAQTLSQATYIIGQLVYICN